MSLQVAGLSKRYGPLLAVDDVTFTVEDGGALGLVGESGSGKTTTARIIAGLERADAGTVMVDGADRAGPARGRGQRLNRARQIQMVFQDPYLSLDPRLTTTEALGEIVALHEPGSRHSRRHRVAELLDQVGLGQREAAALPRQLSGGQRQRVAIARTLAARPRLLILDEAVAALDVSIQAQILNLLIDLRRQTGIGYLFVSHDLAVVRYVTEQVAVMHSGRIVEQGATHEVLARPQHAYTRLLLASVPRRGWDPAAVSRARRDLHDTTSDKETV
ncbi:ATP-binding cassette domain-containing protein [Micromonospora phytophila]|uniref:ABC transporter ATP-binding protein n=1 Tax=Micromonospora phytophila TaxID=709888 RepID=UPI002030CAA6|nr:ATP-binding cassette domain-containing protein [Micromonospora phytophila]MCM0673308.1 ATP-binding cassette domain-containing protein [Micromonospora phytophila]